MAKKEKDFFNDLVNNAFDFLEKAAVDATNHQNAVIFFCTGIELILKARLLKEHWSLIVDGEPDKRKFESGEFKSINFKDLIPRIRKSLGETISDDAKNCFDLMANHRNKMVHFFHEGSSDPVATGKIVAEQYRGWFFLKKLFDAWGEIFEGHHQRINKLDGTLKKNSKFLNASFDILKPEIKALVDNGAVVKICRSCNYKSAIAENIVDTILEIECKVCSHRDTIAIANCEECNKKFEYYELENEQISCPHCEVEFSIEDMKRMLGGPIVDPFDGGDDVVNCANCQGLNSVVKLDKVHVCVICLYYEDHVAYCDWCSEGEIGGGELLSSYVNGCDFCDGRGIDDD